MAMANWVLGSCIKLNAVERNLTFGEHPVNGTRHVLTGIMEKKVNLPINQIQLYRLQINHVLVSYNHKSSTSDSDNLECIPNGKPIVKHTRIGYFTAHMLLQPPNTVFHRRNVHTLTRHCSQSHENLGIPYVQTTMQMQNGPQQLQRAVQLHL